MYNWEDKYAMVLFKRTKVNLYPNKIFNSVRFLLLFVELFLVYSFEYNFVIFFLQQNTFYFKNLYDKHLSVVIIILNTNILAVLHNKRYIFFIH